MEVRDGLQYHVEEHNRRTEYLTILPVASELQAAVSSILRSVERIHKDLPNAQPLFQELETVQVTRVLDFLKARCENALSDPMPKPGKNSSVGPRILLTHFVNIFERLGIEQTAHISETNPSGGGRLFDFSKAFFPSMSFNDDFARALVKAIERAKESATVEEAALFAVRRKG